MDRDEPKYVGVICAIIPYALAIAFVVGFVFLMTSVCTPTPFVVEDSYEVYGEITKLDIYTTGKYGENVHYIATVYFDDMESIALELTINQYSKYVIGDVIAVQITIGAYEGCSTKTYYKLAEEEISSATQEG